MNETSIWTWNIQPSSVSLIRNKNLHSICLGDAEKIQFQFSTWNTDFGRRRRKIWMGRNQVIFFTNITWLKYIDPKWTFWWIVKVVYLRNQNVRPWPSVLLSMFNPLQSSPVLARSRTKICFGILVRAFGFLFNWILEILKYVCQTVELFIVIVHDHSCLF